MVTGLSDIDITRNIIEQHKSRKRAVYYRKDSEGNLIMTLPLPADPMSIMHYLSKGFTLKPEQETDGVKCPMPGCDFTAQNALGLRTHLNKHISESKKEES